MRRQTADRTRLSWPGRAWEPGARTPASATPLETIELPWDARETGHARLVHGDCLDVATSLAAEGLEGAVDLVYLDPPFASQAAYVHEARLDGPADGRVIRAHAYDDRWNAGTGRYLDMLAPRLEALSRLLSASGTIWVHVDWRASYLVRVLLDEILGSDAFVNEIVWRRAPNLGRQAASHQFGRTLDTIVVYGGPAARLSPPLRLEPIEPAAIRFDDQGRPFTTAPRGDYTDASIRRLDAEGRIHRTGTGKAYVKYFLVRNGVGALCRERRVDALWTDVAPLRHARPGERTGFPTQKPRSLLDRIVACATPPGGLVVDLFGGSGTTGESAHALGRRFVLGDASPLSLATARARLLRAGVPLAVQRVPGVQAAPPGTAPSARMKARGRRAIVTLLSPAEPLAWAIDPRSDIPGLFRTAWHSERAPGARAHRVELEASVPEVSGPVAVRVWYDDGSTATTVVGS